MIRSWSNLEIKNLAETYMRFFSFLSFIHISLHRWCCPSTLQRRGTFLAASVTEQAHKQQELWEATWPEKQHFFFLLTELCCSHVLKWIPWATVRMGGLMCLGGCVSNSDLEFHSVCCFWWSLHLSLLTGKSFFLRLKKCFFFFSSPRIL